MGMDEKWLRRAERWLDRIERQIVKVWGDAENVEWDEVADGEVCEIMMPKNRSEKGVAN